MFIEQLTNAQVIEMVIEYFHMTSGVPANIVKQKIADGSIPISRHGDIHAYYPITHDGKDEIYDLYIDDDNAELHHKSQDPKSSREEFNTRKLPNAQLNKFHKQNMYRLFGVRYLKYLVEEQKRYALQQYNASKRLVEETSEELAALKRGRNNDKAAYIAATKVTPSDMAKIIGVSLDDDNPTNN